MSTPERRIRSSEYDRTGTAHPADPFWPHASLAYAIQAWRGLNRALQAEVNDGMLTERQAVALATRFMRTNQEACFDLAGTRAAIHAAIA